MEPDIKSSQTSDPFDALVTWMLEGGSEFEDLAFKQYSSAHRGVHALRDIPQNSVILSVPLSRLLTKQHAIQSKIGQLIRKSGIRLSNDDTYLAAFLLYERARGCESEWQAYINTLPAHYGNVPIFWSQQFIDTWLQGSMAIQKINDRSSYLHHHHL